MDPFTFLFRKATFKADRNVNRDNYPLDLNGSLRYTSPKTGYDFWPAHDNADNFAQLGQVSGFMPQQDPFVWAQGYGKMPSGPIVSALPLNLTWQMTVPGLSKQDSP